MTHEDKQPFENRHEEGQLQGARSGAPETYQPDSRGCEHRATPQMASAAGFHRADYFGAKLGMWLFLFTELLLFGGLFLLYAAYLHRYPAEFSTGGRQLDWVLGTVNTVILLTSSLCAAASVTAVQRGETRRAILLLVGTIFCAACFIAVKYVEWSAKFAHGIYPGSQKLTAGPPGESVFFSLYFLTTGIHGIHVLIGAAVLGWVAARVKSGSITAGDHVLLENSTLYWHLVDLVWIFIFPLYYLIL